MNAFIMKLQHIAMQCKMTQNSLCQRCPLMKQAVARRRRFHRALGHPAATDVSSGFPELYFKGRSMAKGAGGCTDGICNGQERIFT